MKHLSSILLTISIFIYTSCDKANNGADVCNDVVCSGIYATVLVNVQDINRNEVSLFDFYTIRKSTGDTIRLPRNNGAMPFTSPYTVLSDYYMNVFKNRSDHFRFIGIKDGKTVIDQEYFITADCCHIKKVTGPDTITIP
ncbi:MAG: hypothetical protein R2800_14200 [Flavipsychrobacter sp.]